MSLTTLAERSGSVGSIEKIDELSQHKRRIAETEGSRVIVTIPRIDYGFSGSFSNAFIQMNKALTDRNGQDYFDTKGPDWNGGCRKGRHAYTGTVQIVEATASVLRGAYQANVVDPELQGMYFCRTMPVYRSIQGRFTIQNPELGEKPQKKKICRGYCRLQPQRIF